MGQPDQRRHDRGPDARTKWRGRFYSILPIVVALMLVVLAVLTVVSVAAFTGLQRADRALERSRITATNGCQRVQFLRDDQNVTAWGVYTVLDQPSTDPQQFARLFARVDGATQALLMALLESGADGRKLGDRVKNAQRYGPPTNCERASRNPRYRFPQPIPFSAVAGCYDPDTNPRPRKPCRRR